MKTLLIYIFAVFLVCNVAFAKVLDTGQTKEKFELGNKGQIKSKTSNPTETNFIFIPFSIDSFSEKDISTEKVFGIVNETKGFKLILHKTFAYCKRPECFGISKNPPVVPYSFAIKEPEGSIYIPDPINENIKVISRTGNIEKVIPFGGIYDDIRVDQKGNIYILDRGRQRVLVLSPEGKLIKEYELDYEMVKEPCKLKIRNSEIFLDFIDASASRHEMINIKTKERVYDLYELGIDEDEERLDIFLHKDRNVHIIASIKVANILGANFLGTDNNGNIFVEVETKKPDIGVFLKVLKFNQEGNLLGDYTIPHNDYTGGWTARELDIDSQGNIYQVLPAEDRIEINIWETQ